MINYIIKRILLMIPTFVLISLIIFVVLNLAPGDPSAQATADGTETVSQDAQQAYRMFQEQFNLDKPILVNTRFRLTVEDVEEKVQAVADFQRPLCLDEEAQELLELEEEIEEAEEELAPEAPPAPDEEEAGPGAAVDEETEELLDAIDDAVDPDEEDCTPVEDRPSSALIISAQETLSDWGDYAVAELLEIAQHHERADMRHLALNQLSSNARQPLLARSDMDPPPHIREQNREIASQNNQIRRWQVPMERDDQSIVDEKQDVVTEMVEDNWVPWFEERQDRFEFEGSEKIHVFFFDTRFARYWSNLNPFSTRPTRDEDGSLQIPISLGTPDFGLSTVDRRPVMDTIIEKLPYSITLGFLAIFLAYLISVPIGIWSAYNQNTRKDQFVTVLLFMLYSLPSFFTAVLLIEFFSVGRPFNWFPTGGFIADSARDMPILTQLRSVAWHIFLPVACLTYGSLAALSRYARTGVLDVIRADYIRTARAKGLSEPMVILKHAVRNGMIPILTLMGTMLPFVVSGSLVIEYIFNIPGIGLYLFESIHQYDYNAIMGVLLISTVVTLVGILLSDISYAIVDPRITFD